MPISRGEALAAGKKLLRTFDSAPEPRRQARALYAELTRAAGWTGGERRQIEAFGEWLISLPSVSELKPRCGELLAQLR
jgi:hypothetical protein